MNPLVSIVIPCYNHGRYLAGAIESALAQTHQPIEIIVVDDGSSDESAKVADSFRSRVRTIRQTNRGLSAARNTGAREADGEYLVFLDADDLLDDNYVASTLDLLRRRADVVYVYTQMRLFGARGGTTRHPDFDLNRLKYGGYINASALMRADVVRRFPFDEALREGWEDWDFYLTLAENGQRGALLDEPLLRYRKHSSPSMVDRLRERSIRKRVITKIYRKHWRLYGAADWARFAVKYVVYSIPPLYHLVRTRADD